MKDFLNKEQLLFSNSLEHQGFQKCHIPSGWSNTFMIVSFSIKITVAQIFFVKIMSNSLKKEQPFPTENKLPNKFHILIHKWIKAKSLKVPSEN